VWNKPNKKSFVNGSVYNIFFGLPHLVAVMAKAMSKKEIFLKKLGKNIARLREKADLSQTELALRCDKDRQSLNRLEKGRINPSAYYLLEIATELDVSVTEFFNFE
jgi:putative transcriptional regulator